MGCVISLKTRLHSKRSEVVLWPDKERAAQIFKHLLEASGDERYAFVFGLALHGVAVRSVLCVALAI